jgi:hypothetical protein
MNLEDKIEEFKDEIDKFKKRLNDIWETSYKELIKRFPFKYEPDKIDDLSPDDIYNPGNPGYFLDYVEHKLKLLGHIYVPSDRPWRSARDNLDEFKRLLKIVVNDISLADKIDAEWQNLPGWGGDKHYAKKIIFLYHPDEIIPIFKTKHLEHFNKVLGLWNKVNEKALGKYKKSYENLSLGQKYELLNRILLEFKNSHEAIKKWDNALFTYFLYRTYPPSEPIKPTKVVEPLSATRLLFSPANELGVVALFSMYHKELGFPYIVKVKPDFPDAIIIDREGNVKTVEFELYASHFIAHRHDPTKCDYIICWEDDLDESAREDLLSKNRELKVISLKDRLGEIEE